MVSMQGQRSLLKISLETLETMILQTLKITSFSTKSKRLKVFLPVPLPVSIELEGMLLVENNVILKFPWNLHWQFHGIY